MSVVDTLKRAISILDNQGWTTGSLWEEYGKVQGPVCLIGAVALAKNPVEEWEKAEEGDHEAAYNWYGQSEEARLIASCITEKHGEIKNSYSNKPCTDVTSMAWTFNDQTEDSYGERIVEVLECAVRKAENE